MILKAFLWAREGLSTSNLEALLRSLLHQIFCHRFQKVLDKLGPQLFPHHGQGRLDVRELLELLFRLLKLIGESQIPIYLFIDAIDENDISSIAQLVTDLLEMAHDADFEFHFCISETSQLLHSHLRHSFCQWTTTTRPISGHQ